MRSTRIIGHCWRETMYTRSIAASRLVRPRHRTTSYVCAPWSAALIRYGHPSSTRLSTHDLDYRDNITAVYFPLFTPYLLLLYPIVHKDLVHPARITARMSVTQHYRDVPRHKLDDETPTRLHSQRSQNVSRDEPSSQICRLPALMLFYV